jgi:hypothetical protein
MRSLTRIRIRRQLALSRLGSIFSIFRLLSTGDFGRARKAPSFTKLGFCFGRWAIFLVDLALRCESNSFDWLGERLICLIGVSRTLVGLNLGFAETARFETIVWFISLLKQDEERVRPGTSENGLR